MLGLNSSKAATSCVSSLPPIQSQNVDQSPKNDSGSHGNHDHIFSIATWSAFMGHFPWRTVKLRRVGRSWGKRFCSEALHFAVPYFEHVWTKDCLVKTPDFEPHWSGKQSPSPVYNEFDQQGSANIVNHTQTKVYSYSFFLFSISLSLYIITILVIIMRYHEDCHYYVYWWASRRK
jgi:hypothetical protein